MLIDCPGCKNRVLHNAETCPHCGIKIKDTKAAYEAASAEHRSDPASVGFGVIFVSLLPILLLTWLFWPSSDSPSKPALPAHDESGAWVMCKEFIERRLKSPKSADYPWYRSEYVTRLGGARYRVESYVEAQNSFGAEIRNYFSCTVRWAGGDEWRLEDLTME